MPFTFVPGEINKKRKSLAQLAWKGNLIAVYLSGNNLIITSHVESSSPTVSLNHLQTIYLEADPTVVDINDKNAYITISINSKIIIFKPENEHMRKPRWVQALEFRILKNSTINCMKWAPLEDEIVIGTDDHILLYYIYEEYGDLKYKIRWTSLQSTPIHRIDITYNSSKIVSSSNQLDRFVKVWNRINFGDENTLFELSYLPHPDDNFVVDLKCRYKVPQAPSSMIDESMANIKNIRGYFNLESEEQDTIYTMTNDKLLRVWSSYEYNGHSHIRCWASLNLDNVFENDELLDYILIENYYLQRSLKLQILDIQDQTPFKGVNLDNIDLIMAISKKGYVSLFYVDNIIAYPPSSIRFIKLDYPHIKLAEDTFPKTPVDFVLGSLDDNSYSTTEFDIFMKPICLTPVNYLHGSNISPLSILIHDRVKNTVRVESLDFSFFVNGDNSMVKLLEKYEGHTKSIRKLIKSNSNRCQNNILLSILNFPEHNYIWEPLSLDSSSSLSISKKFRINLCSNGEKSEGIYDAILINDIESPIKGNRHHLLVVFENGNFLSVWDCKKNSPNDTDGILVRKFNIFDEDQDSKVLKALVSRVHPKKPNCHIILAIFDNNIVFAWEVFVSPTISINKIAIDNLPNKNNIQYASSDDTILNLNEDHLLSVIDKFGTLSLYSIDFSGSKLKWHITTKIETSIEECSKISGSAILNKIAILDSTGFKISVWDTKARVLEYEETFILEHGKVRDVDWNFIDSSLAKLTSNAILSLGFDRIVLLYSQLRYDYTNKIPSYAVIKNIDISEFTSHTIGDSIWLDDGFLIIGSGNQFFIDDRWVKLEDNQFITSTIRELMSGYTEKIEDEDDGAGYKTKRSSDTVYEISHLVRSLNGPLPVFHPQFLIQCLFFNQFSLVMDILVRLFRVLRKGTKVSWDLNMNMAQEIFTYSGTPHSSKSNLVLDLLEDVSPTRSGLDVFSRFNSSLAELLTSELMKVSLPLLTRHQQITLINIISIVNEIENYTNVIDENGIRFLVGFKLCQMSSKQSRLTMRDVNWALHSENKEVLFGIIENYYKSKFTWKKVANNGLPYWVDTIKLSKLLESCARNEFGESKDPSGIISLLYLTINKKKVLLNLWKTSTHSEQQKMVKFLSNDFSEPRWRSAALKNAFVLLGKHRYIDAASFFLLADSLKDCCRTIANKVDDIELAIAIAKVYSLHLNNTSNGEASRMIIEDFALPKAMQDGNKWLASWSFWELSFKELAIQALVKTPYDVILSNKQLFSEEFIKNRFMTVTIENESRNFLNNDPALILLYNALRQKNLKYFTGALNIDPREEFDFIIRVCLIYTRMGCDYLAIVLIKHWNFMKFDKGANKVKWANYEQQNSNFKKTVTDDTSKPEYSRKLSFNRRNLVNVRIGQFQPPPTAAFEEPDMSSFNFGF